MNSDHLQGSVFSSGEDPNTRLWTRVDVCLGGTPSKSATHRDRSPQWGRLKAKVEPLLTSGNNGLRTMPGRNWKFQTATLRSKTNVEAGGIHFWWHSPPQVVAG